MFALLVFLLPALLGPQCALCAAEGADRPTVWVQERTGNDPPFSVAPIADDIDHLKKAINAEYKDKYISHELTIYAPDPNGDVEVELPSGGKELYKKVADPRTKLSKISADTYLFEPPASDAREWLPWAVALLVVAVSSVWYRGVKPYDLLTRRKSAHGLMVAIQQAKLNPIRGAKADLRTLSCSQAWPCESGKGIGMEKEKKICLVRQQYIGIVNDFLTDTTGQNVVLIGQPGIGKSFAGAYAVWKALKSNKAVIWEIREFIFVFDPINKNAWVYDRSRFSQMRAVEACPDAFLIHDCQRDTTKPLTHKGFRTMTVSSPQEAQFKDWAKQTEAKAVYLDVWTDDEIEDMVAALSLDPKRVLSLRREFGPIPRHLVINDAAAELRRSAVSQAITALQRCDDPLATLLQEPTEGDHPSHKLMMMTTRTCTPGRSYKYVPCNNGILAKLYQQHKVVIKRVHADWLQLINDCDRGVEGSVFEHLYAPCLLHGGNLRNLLVRATPLGAPASPLPTFPAGDLNGVELKKHDHALTLADDTLYWSTDKSFAVFDWFIKKGNHVVGLQFTVSNDHGPNCPSLGKLHNTFEQAFLPGTFATIATWSIVFVQRPIDDPITVRQPLRKKFTLQTPRQYWPSHLVPAHDAEPTNHHVRSWNKFADQHWAAFHQYQATPQ